ncbi:MAG TPA: NAD(P)/FAD-dependent oxidoreductase [Terriglobales bacterium]|nr:NAD(P)/FAD-dependent oxidoreductase [Terriglobales bacterium]
MESPYDVAVIGGGVVGCAVVRELARYRLRLLLLEKEADLGEGVTKANSGVIHAGFNVPVGSLKARTNVAGLSRTYALAAALHVPHRRTGKLVVALSDAERPRLEELKAQGDRSGVPGLEIVGEDAIRTLEPLARGRWALHSPWTGIISPYEFTIALAESALRSGAEVWLEAPVVSVGFSGGLFRLGTPKGDFAARRVVNSAGLFADDVARLAGIDEYRIVPFRGEYLVTDKDPGFRLGMPLYPVPPPDDPGLGIHITPTMEGNVLLGPSAEPVADKTNTASTRPVMDELKEEAVRLMPELRRAPFIHTYAGVRPKLVDPSGRGKFRDFVVEESELRPGWVNLVGIESPGLTSSPAIAEMVAALLGAGLDLRPKPDFEEGLPDRPRFAALGDPERAGRVAGDADWGEMVCRCEHVTRAEVAAALRNPFGARTLDAVKRRTRCGMGRCQGGFCTPRIVEIMQEEGLPLDRITKRGGGSRLFYGRIKR